MSAPIPPPAVIPDCIMGPWFCGFTIFFGSCSKLACLLGWLRLWFGDLREDSFVVLWIPESFRYGCIECQTLLLSLKQKIEEDNCLQEMGVLYTLRLYRGMILSVLFFVRL